MKWMSQKHVDLGSGSVGRLLLSLAAPTITSQIVNMLYNLVDRVYIGHMQPTDTVGKLALTGVGVCLPVILIISAFAALGSMGGAAIGAGSIVTKDVPAWHIVVGNPAHELRPRFADPAVALGLERLAWWNWPEETLRARWKLFQLPAEDFLCKAQELAEG